MDELIQAVAKALKNKHSIKGIHKAILDRGWSEDDAFLAIKAGENLHQAMVRVEEEIKKRPPPFGRRNA